MLEVLIGLISLSLSWKFTHPMNSHNPTKNLEIFAVVTIALYLTLMALVQSLINQAVTFITTRPMIAAGLVLLVVIVIGSTVWLVKQGWLGQDHDSSPFEW